MVSLVLVPCGIRIRFGASEERIVTLQWHFAIYEFLLEEWLRGAYGNISRSDA